jgi:glutaminase
MGRSVVQTALDRVLRSLLNHREGDVASYIPELTLVDPDRFGIAVATVDGHVYGAGDDEQEFTIQSISKPFVYGMALDERGEVDVLQRVGVEPSGDAFNSIVMDEVHNRPLNPMVNAGAIACAAMVSGAALDDRRQKVLDAFGRYAGRPLTIDEAVCDSERRTGNRNRAIAYLELSSGMIDEPVADHLDLYFSQCSILVTARDLALMAATLANGGAHPITGERALQAEHVSQVLTVMATCGMYDWSGEWMFRVGLPAKSGVGGGIIAVLPGQLGIGTFSPRLDSHGNSCRGVRACEELGRTFSLHLLDTTATSAPVVRNQYNARQVPSKRLRRGGDRALLDEAGDQIVVLELQGDLYFSTAEQLVRTVETAVGEARYIVLDMRRVGRATASALSLLVELRQSVEATEGTLLVAGGSDALRAAISAAEVAWPATALWSDVDSAIEQAENAVLAEQRGAEIDDESPVALSEVDVLRDLGVADLAEVEARLETSKYEAGAEILREGDSADRLCFLIAGSATVRIAIGDGSGRTRRIRTFGPGTVFGESAVLEGGRRNANVVADGPAIVSSLPIEALEQLSATKPAVHAHLLAGVGLNLSEMLRRAVAEIRALDA